MRITKRMIAIVEKIFGAKAVNNRPWIAFNDSFDYEKIFYDVKLPDGTVFEQCYPNAQKMRAIHTSNQPSFTRKDGVMVRKSATHPLDGLPQE